MKNLVRALRAMADEPRMTILSVLSIRGAVCVSHLQEAMKTPQPTVSRYLSILRNAGLLESERRGQWVYYSLGHDDGSLVMEMITRASQQLKETAKIKRIMERLDKLEQQPPLTDEAVQAKPAAKPKVARRLARRLAKAVNDEEAPPRIVLGDGKPDVAGLPEAEAHAKQEPYDAAAEPSGFSTPTDKQRQEDEPVLPALEGNEPELEGKKRARKKKQQLPSLFDL